MIKLKISKINFLLLKNITTIIFSLLLLHQNKLVNYVKNLVYYLILIFIKNYYLLLIKFKNIYYWI